MQAFKPCLYAALFVLLASITPVVATQTVGKDASSTEVIAKGGHGGGKHHSGRHHSGRHHSGRHHDGRHYRHGGSVYYYNGGYPGNYYYYRGVPRVYNSPYYYNGYYDDYYYYEQPEDGVSLYFRI